MDWFERLSKFLFQLKNFFVTHTYYENITCNIVNVQNCCWQIINANFMHAEVPVIKTRWK